MKTLNPRIIKYTLVWASFLIAAPMQTFACDDEPDDGCDGVTYAATTSPTTARSTTARATADSSATDD